MLRNLEESLKYLKTDYVDVMQLQGASVEDCERGEMVEALQLMWDQGKVEWIGHSTNLPTFLDWNKFDVLQLPYSA